MGDRRDEFAQTILEAISDLVPNIDTDTIEMRVSRNARYISLTISIDAISQQHLDSVYLRLTSHPWVKVVL